MNIARRKPDQTTYNQAIYFGQAIAPSLMDPHRRILHGIKDSGEAQLIRQRAMAETALKGRYITPLEIVNDDIKELTSQTLVVPDAELLKGRSPSQSSSRKIVIED